MKPRDAERSKNFFALGLVSWLYTRPTSRTVEWIETRFVDAPEVKEANLRAFRAGFDFGETAELVRLALRGQAAPLAPGEYATSPATPRCRGGSITAAQQAKPAALLGQLPDHAGVRHPPRAVQAQGVRRAARSRPKTRSPRSAAAIGAATAARSAITTTSGPGVDLKSRGDRARDQPRAAAAASSTSSAAVRRPGCRRRSSRPTCCSRCTGGTASRRCRSSPRSTPSHCFDAALEAVRIAVELPHAGDPALRRLPRQRLRAVEPPRRRRIARRPGLRVGAEPRPTPTATSRSGPTCATRTLARPWAPRACRASSTASAASRSPTAPGTVSYDAQNHEQMTRIRAANDRADRRDDPRRRRRRPEDGADSSSSAGARTYGAIDAAVARLRAAR